MYLLDWLAVFDREQLLVLRLEDHASDVKSTMRRVCQFLSLGMQVEGRWSLWAEMGREGWAGPGRDGQGGVGRARRDGQGGMGRAGLSWEALRHQLCVVWGGVPGRDGRSPGGRDAAACSPVEWSGGRVGVSTGARVGDGGPAAAGRGEGSCLRRKRREACPARRPSASASVPRVQGR